MYKMSLQFVFSFYLIGLQINAWFWQEDASHHEGDSSSWCRVIQFIAWPRWIFFRECPNYACAQCPPVCLGPGATGSSLDLELKKHWTLRCPAWNQVRMWLWSSIFPARKSAPFTASLSCFVQCLLTRPRPGTAPYHRWRAWDHTLCTEHCRSGLSVRLDSLPLKSVAIKPHHAHCSA